MRSQMTTSHEILKRQMYYQYETIISDSFSSIPNNFPTNGLNLATVLQEPILFLIRNCTRYVSKINEKKVYVPTLRNDYEIRIKYTITVPYRRYKNIVHSF